MLRNSTDEELVFFEHYFDKREEEQWHRWSKMLGILWERSDVVTKDAGGMVTKLFLPLAASLKPELMDVVKKILGQDIPEGIGVDENGYQVAELGDLDPDKFKEMLHIFDQVAKD